jgi:hypothetical protein
MRKARTGLVSVLALLVLGVLAAPASATHNLDRHLEADEIFTSGNLATNSDLAFWGKYAFVGYYTGSTGFPPGTGARGGVRIFDISDPAQPLLVRDFACDGPQSDPILWDRNNNGVPDLLLLGVDSTMANPNCGAARVPGGTPTGWEGVRVFTMSDNPRSPFTTITPVANVYTDCGAHTITAMPLDSKRDPSKTKKLNVYISSYPLGAGPTCGDTEFLNMANPYDGDPGQPASPLHGVIQVVQVPLKNPAASRELGVQPRISYPGDPDGRMEWCEKGLCAGFEPAAIACHDIVVHVEHRVAGGACAEQGQVWEIDRNGIPDTENPMSVGDDEVSSGGTGQFPGAVDFFHSVMFDNDAETVNWVDESFGTGCPTRTNYQPRPWNPAGGNHETGRMFFSDMEGNFQSEFNVGDVRPDTSPGEYCSSHMGMAVMGIKKDLLVNAWYTGGMDVIDFTDPENLRETAYYDPERVSGTWSAYPYTGPVFRSGPGTPVYASDGVTSNGNSQGMVVYRARNVPLPPRHERMRWLNPQTMDHEAGRVGGGDDDSDSDSDDRGGGRDRDSDSDSD